MLQLSNMKVGVGSGSKMIWSTENWKPLHYWYARFPHKLRLWNQNTGFRLWLQLCLHYCSRHL